MASYMSKVNGFLTPIKTKLNCIRNKHTLSLTPFSRARNKKDLVPNIVESLEEILAKGNKDPELDELVDIGLKDPLTGKVAKEEMYSVVKDLKQNQELERADRLRQLVVSIDEVRKEWRKTRGPYHLCTIADHYGIYTDLFQHAFFVPFIPLDITYDYKEDYITPVYSGNRLKPSDVQKAPKVEFNADDNTWWSLAVTNPDCHFQDPTSEYLHWFIGNIPAGRVQEGEVLCDYLQPFPAKGSGYQRFIFILYKQEGKLDWSSYKRPSPCHSLPQRTFKTFDFYKKHQEVITPAGLSFFQTDWDETLKDFFHNVLMMREPSFEYDFPPPFIRPQKKFADIKVPFNVYLDRHRDPKDIAKDVFVKRLKNISPFHPEPPPFPYPAALPIPNKLASWQRVLLRRERLRLGRFKDL